MTVIRQYNPGTSVWEAVAVGAGVPTGGTTGQYLRKSSSTDYATGWDTIGTSDVDGLDSALALKAASTPTRKTVSANYTLLSTDAGNIVYASSSSPISIELNVDAMPVNGLCLVVQGGAGGVQFVAGAGATILSLASQKKIAGRYAGVQVWQYSSTTFFLIGALAA
jgi:hypothetical protein